MSAFVVSNKHIDVLVWSAFEQNHGVRFHYVVNNEFVESDSPNRIGTILLNENIRSVNARYEENDLYRLYQYQVPREPHLLQATQIFKACDCYEYQACETEDYYRTPARSIITEIRRITTKRLPDYDVALWSIE